MVHLRQRRSEAHSTTGSDIDTAGSDARRAAVQEAYTAYLVSHGLLNPSPSPVGRPAPVRQAARQRGQVRSATTKTTAINTGSQVLTR